MQNTKNDFAPFGYTRSCSERQKTMTTTATATLDSQLFVLFSGMGFTWQPAGVGGDTRQLQRRLLRSRGLVMMMHSPLHPTNRRGRKRMALRERCCRCGQRLTSINACECSRSAKVPGCRSLVRSFVRSFIRSFELSDLSRSRFWSLSCSCDRLRSALFVRSLPISPLFAITPSSCALPPCRKFTYKRASSAGWY